jgi:signal peptidase I
MAELTTTLFTELLHSVGHARIEVLGSSMLPVIQPGDILRVEAVTCHPGDVIVFNRDGVLCAHRLLAIVDGMAIARGDANRRLDAPFPTEQILGRVIDFQRGKTIVRDLSAKPMASFFVRNSSLIRRVFLRLLSMQRKRMLAGSMKLNPSPSKLQA